MAKSLSTLIKTKLTQKQQYGYSRHQAKQDHEGKSPYIHSKTTYETYRKHCLQFGSWCKENYGCKTPLECAHYTKEYLEYCTSQGNSAATLATKGAAIAKLFDTGKDHLGFKFPEVKRAEITRDRIVRVALNDKHQAARDFIAATGLRAGKELSVLKVKDVYRDAKTGRLMVHVTQGKGGREREVTVLRSGEKTVLKILAGKSDDDLVMKDFSRNAITENQLHAFRAQYACDRYRELEADGVTKSKRYDKDDLYHCRKDLAGTTYKKALMEIVSNDLGHSRISVIAQSYLWKLSDGGGSA